LLYDFSTFLIGLHEVAYRKKARRTLSGDGGKTVPRPYLQSEGLLQQRILFHDIR